MTREPSDLCLSPRLTPHGQLLLAPLADAPALDLALARRLQAAFARGAGHGLLRLGAAEVATALPPALSYFRELGRRHVTAICARPDVEDRSGEIEPPDLEELERLARAGPAMPGAEYLTADVLGVLWRELGAAFGVELGESGSTVQGFLERQSPVWNVVGRVCFNLAENRKDEQAPFAFLATYSRGMSAHGSAQHQPLGQALREYAGAANKARLLSLLVPVQRAAERCPWLRQMVDASEIFHPLRWTPDEALRLLHDAPELERAGVVVRMPAGWRGGRPARPRATATVGAKAVGAKAAGAGLLGAGALLDFQLDVTLDGERLAPGEVEAILASASGLSLVRGQWVEVDRERLAQALARFREVEARAKREGIGFSEAMRLIAGARIAASDDEKPDEAERGSGWSHVTAGPWLEATLRGLRDPEALAAVAPGRELRGTLRPYQQRGVRWLHWVSRLGLGACLADDMGLGKTVQILALLLLLRAERDGPKQPSLLVAPASLLANWVAEAERFAPSLRLLVAHGSARPAAELAALSAESLHDVDLVITSYGSLERIPWLGTTAWRLAILDEAQAIKNPGARQTRAAKQLKAQSRIALTGTPVENRLGDLWSLFDFTHPGLLGSAKEFGRYAKGLAAAPGNPYGPLRDLTRPFILRRLKTDRTVIADLPDKTEVDAFCQLTKKQAALYQQAVTELSEALESAEGIQRRGVVLASLMRLKQICNHPSQWLGDGGFSEDDSGKWARLRLIAEVIADKQEKLLVFTQFQQIAAPLAAFLGSVFGRPGLVLHGGTAVRQRKALVEQFQGDESVPFFVLSLKAGGSGLNLTAASQVVHFDRWWNPAVENQATDRAFRIGQKKNVLVHKFVCRGTVEEKIAALIESKKQLSRDLLEGGTELDLTSLGDQELLKLMSLDLESATQE
ncbi:MAG: DEAD/DEAH box helicase [Polyangiaceae bacterium]|nr:DEAD/DEAH box helicase [Polyangiaceae bacterium]